ncbi:MAG: hypothetical protein KDK70_35640 [Myxococcales bacterium]|nr:hypothetical protein [Myxococcales bacterium]
MRHYRLGTELPPRPTEPGRPALPLRELWARCREALDERSIAAVEALMALDRHGDGDDAGPEADLPAATIDREPAARMRGRMEAAGRLAAEAGSELLVAWVAYEVALREALAARRAAALGRPWSAPALVVADRAAALAPMVAGVMTNACPRQRQRALDAARLRELEQMTDGDPFSTDAVLAHVVAALVVDRWDFDDGDALPEEVWT